jgi:anti-sigma-K factor RskA
MDIKAYIASGILELYVAGTLSEQESKDVYALLLKHPELLNEVEKIESAIVKLTAAASPSDSKAMFTSIKDSLNFGQNDTKVIPIGKAKTNYFSYVGWAASILLTVGLFWLSNQNNELKTKISTAESDKEFLEFQIEKANGSLTEAKKLISVLRDRDIISVPLDGQAVYPEAYAKVYWDKSTSNIYLDVQGLPAPPEGKVYQVWSLTLNPLSPTSLGTLDDFNTDENKIFTISNPNGSQAFGITLEPAGGSASPTMEQLYTLGVVSAS